MCNLTLPTKVIWKLLFLASLARGAGGLQAIPWLACASAVEVNRAVASWVEPGDCVVEFGAQLKETSNIICKSITATGTALLCDIERKSPRSATSRNANFRREGDSSRVPPQADFVALDSFEAWRRNPVLDVCLKGNSAPCDVLVCDIGGMTGNDLSLSTISFIREFLGRSDHQPRVVIVKSTALCGLAWRLVHAQRLFSGSAVLPQVEDTSADMEGFEVPRTAAPHIIATVGVEEYRRTIPYAVSPGDSVVEVGCHLGRTTSLLNEAAGKEDGGGCIVGVDIGPRIINRAKDRYPDIEFVVGDAWRTADLQRLRQQHSTKPQGSSGHICSPSSSFDAVYIDVGGLSGSDGLLEALSLIGSLGNALEPRVIVIKSLCMRRLASSLRPFSESWIKERRLKQNLPLSSSSGGGSS